MTIPPRIFHPHYESFDNDIPEKNNITASTKKASRLVNIRVKTNMYKLTFRAKTK